MRTGHFSNRALIGTHQASPRRDYNGVVVVVVGAVAGDGEEGHNLRCNCGERLPTSPMDAGGGQDGHAGNRA